MRLPILIPMSTRSREKQALGVFALLVVLSLLGLGWYLVAGHSWNVAASTIDEKVGQMDGYTAIVYSGTVLPEIESKSASASTGSSTTSGANDAAASGSAKSLFGSGSTSKKDADAASSMGETRSEEAYGFTSDIAGIAPVYAETSDSQASDTAASASAASSSADTPTADVDAQADATKGANSRTAASEGSDGEIAGGASASAHADVSEGSAGQAAGNVVTSGRADTSANADEAANASSAGASSATDSAAATSAHEQTASVDGGASSADNEGSADNANDAGQTAGRNALTTTQKDPVKPEAVQENYLEKGANVLVLDTMHPSIYEDGVIVKRASKRIGVFYVDVPLSEEAASERIDYFKDAKVDLIVCISSVRSYVRNAQGIDIVITLQDDVSTLGTNSGGTFYVNAPEVDSVGAILLSPSNVVSAKVIESL